MGQAETLAVGTSERGEVHLRRRADGALELRVNGVFVMDDQETRSEELLATAALEVYDATSAGLTVLVGGLGLGYTVRALLHDPRVGTILVAEIEADLVEWMRSGLIPSVLDDPRVIVEVGDVREIVAARAGRGLDGILLDVDNGPDFLVYDGNSAIYQPGFLRTCEAALRPGGVLTVWSSSASDHLAQAMAATYDESTVRPVPVELQGRDETYYVYQGQASS
ncbi:spermidine synthase [Kribbella deserti]|uniref:Spermidine synthase n=1 Tax=Kribbella deserti TaxID=1926257 RepID=A0ABV6QN20_9ACTN